MLLCVAAYCVQAGCTILLPAAVARHRVTDALLLDLRPGETCRCRLCWEVLPCVAPDLIRSTIFCYRITRQRPLHVHCQLKSTVPGRVAVHTMP